LLAIVYDELSEPRAFKGAGKATFQVGSGREEGKRVGKAGERG
jgi:hypothetical protein